LFMGANELVVPEAWMQLVMLSSDWSPLSLLWLHRFLPRKAKRPTPIRDALTEPKRNQRDGCQPRWPM
jgi:hypothetical protein